MSETNKEIEKLDEVNVAAKDAAPAETTHLKNDAVDMGAPVVKPTDKNPDAASKAKQNTSDPALKSAKDGSNPAGKGDMKPTSMKEEEVEIEATEDQEVVAEEETKEPGGTGEACTGCSAECCEFCADTDGECPYDCVYNEDQSDNPSSCLAPDAGEDVEIIEEVPSVSLMSAMAVLGFIAIFRRK